ncbi:hypothetical protein [Brevundimonas sp. DC300-4]|uniref:hypothetical protein n=1 Tax=Brevundimonas sp. DC300-4 TaxID=2804594 RepID=UPI003CE6D3FB
MSINDHHDTVESAARYAVMKSGAVKACALHPTVILRVGDEGAERRAYALATNIMKSDGSLWMREDVMPAIKDELDLAADGECPRCADIREE